MMRIYISVSIIIMFISFQAKGQTLNEIKELLASKNFVLLHSRLKNKPNHSEACTIFWDGVLRNITPLYQEFYVEFTICNLGNKSDSNIATITPYRINVLATDKEIIYYDIGVKNTFDSTRIINPLSSYRNDTVLLNLKNDFNRFYSNDLNEGDLFENSITYGSRCGAGASKVFYRNQLDSIVLQRDAAILTKWLTSANAEKQVYAVDGLYQLKKLGYAFTDEQKRFIQYIKNKKGNIRVCMGCNEFKASIYETIEIIQKR
jgi:hypothetical protein